MSVKRVVLADALAPEGVRLLEQSGGLLVEDCSSRPRDDLKRALVGAAGLIVRSATLVDSDLIAGADALEVIGRAGAGLDNIDVEAASRRGIAVINAPAGNTTSTAELALALLLSVARGIPAADRSVREGRWERKAFGGVQLGGKTLGVIGAGRIGTEVILRAQAFGMEVLVADPYLPPERSRDLGVEVLPLDDLLARADFVSVHAPLTEETRGLLGEKELARLKDSAFLVNTARGGIVDEEALARALSAGSLAGAALDVLAVEPLPRDHPLRSAPRLVLTPHLGAQTPEAQRQVALEVARHVRDALLQRDYRAVVNLPGVERTDRERLGPVLDLARRLGVVLSEVAGERCRRVDVRVDGGPDRGLRMVAAAAMEGYLRRSLADPVNLINSMLLAAERGIEVTRARAAGSPRLDCTVELRARTNGSDVVVTGALEDGDCRLRRVDGYHVDVEPRGHMLLVRNRDVPGVIGDIGTRLGRSGVNIAEFHQARDPETGEALAVLALDDPVSPELLADLRALPAILDARQVSLDR